MGVNLNSLTTMATQLDLMKKDALTEARETEGRRRGSSEAAHARGKAEGFALALTLLHEHAGVLPGKPAFEKENHE